MLEPYLTVTDGSSVLQVSRQTVYGWIFRRILPHVKVGRLVRIDPRDLSEFLRLRRRGDFATIATDRIQSCPERW
jgi:excisionase family DNA binding protein